VLRTPSRDQYRARLNQRNLAGNKTLHGVMVTQAASVRGTMADSCEPELVKIGTVLGQLFPCVSTDRSPR